MSKILLRENASEPDTPSSGAIAIWADAAGTIKAKRDDGSIDTIGGGAIARNALTNGTFLFAQRQAPGTLTTYSNTTGRSYGPDRWGITNENASTQFRRVDAIAAPETGLGARFYGEVKKITSAGKVILSQWIEGVDSAPYRGRRVRVQFKAKNSVGSHTLRCALVYLSSSGTVDAIPATFVSAFGAASTDPTWGTNLAAVAPTLGSAFSTVSGNGLSSTLTSSWRQYGGVFVVPSSALNIGVAIWTDGLPAANDIFHVAEVGLFDRDEERPAMLTDINDELDRCHRYCCKTFAVETAPASNAGAASGEFRFQATAAGAVASRSPSLFFPARMRATPTITLYNPAAAGSEARDVNASATCSATGAFNASERGCTVHATGAVGTAIGNAFGIHMLAEAEL